MECPLCGSNNIVLNQIYDEGLGGSRYKGRCVECELEVMSDTFPVHTMALKHLMQIWKEIKPCQKTKKYSKKNGKH